MELKRILISRIYFYSGSLWKKKNKTAPAIICSVPQLLVYIKKSSRILLVEEEANDYSRDFLDHGKSLKKGEREKNKKENEWMQSTEKIQI